MMRVFVSNQWQKFILFSLIVGTLFWVLLSGVDFHFLPSFISFSKGVEKRSEPNCEQCSTLLCNNTNNNREKHETLPRVQPSAVVTLAANEEYAVGALVLGKSLLRVNTSLTMVCLILDNISAQTKKELEGVGWTIRQVTPIQNPWEDRSKKRFRGPTVMTKLHLWNMTEFAKILFLDSDVIAIRNPDDAVANCDFFCAVQRDIPGAENQKRTTRPVNTGVMILTPETRIFQNLLTACQNPHLVDNYENTDQGLISAYLFFECQNLVGNNNITSVMTKNFSGFSHFDFESWRGDPRIPGHQPMRKCMYLPEIYNQNPSHPGDPKVRIQHYNHPVKPWFCVARPDNQTGRWIPARMPKRFQKIPYCRKNKHFRNWIEKYGELVGMSFTDLLNNSQLKNNPT